MMAERRYSPLRKTGLLDMGAMTNLLLKLLCVQDALNWKVVLA